MQLDKQQADSSFYSRKMSTQISPPFSQDAASGWMSGFDTWAATRGHPSRSLSEASSAVQRAMWQSFVSWCVARHIDPTKTTVSELNRYLQGREGSASRAQLTPRYALRLVRLIERVIHHMVSSSGDPDNSAVSELLTDNRALRYANDNEKDPLPETLTNTEDQQLVSFLQCLPSKQGQSTVASVEPARWQDSRNRVSVALQRGAGLTPMEVRLLQVSSVDVDAESRKRVWKVRAPATGSVGAHDAPVASWAGSLIASWLETRDRLKIPGPWLLPSTRTGKPWGKTAQYEAVAQVLADAGLVGHRGGGYVLRHTFAMRQLIKTDPGTVAAWLGIEAVEMARYRRVLTAPADVS